MTLYLTPKERTIFHGYSQTFNYNFSDAASGGSYDWAKSVAGIQYAYTYEMRPAEASFGQSGFILSESEIIPNAEEVWASLVTIATEIQY